MGGLENARTQCPGAYNCSAGAFSLIDSAAVDAYRRFLPAYHLFPRGNEFPKLLNKLASSPAKCPARTEPPFHLEPLPNALRLAISRASSNKAIVILENRGSPARDSIR